MSRGIIEAGLFRTERVKLKTRTSDPANPADGERWLRTDRDSGTDKLAELRWFDGSSRRSINIVAPGTTDSDVTEMLRVQTPNGTGVIPAISPPGDAGYPSQRVRHAGADYGLGLAGIPNSGEEKGSLFYKINEGSGSTLNDDYGSNDGTTSGTTWEGGGYKNYYVFFDGGGSDSIEMPSFDFSVDGTQSFSLMWIMRPRDDYSVDRGLEFEDNSRVKFGYGKSSGDIGGSSDEFFFQVNENIWYGDKVSAPTDDLGEWQMWTGVYEYNSRLNLFYYDNQEFSESYSNGKFDTNSARNKIRGDNFGTTAFVCFDDYLTGSEIASWANYWNRVL